MVGDHEVRPPDLLGRQLDHGDARPSSGVPRERLVTPAHGELALQLGDLGRVVHVLDVLDVEVGEDGVRVLRGGFFGGVLAHQKGD